MFNEAINPNWKKTDIVGLVSFAWCWYVVTILCLYFLVSLIAPVSAINSMYYDQAPGNVVNFTDPTPICAADSGRVWYTWHKAYQYDPGGFNGGGDQTGNYPAMTYTLANDATGNGSTRPSLRGYVYCRFSNGTGGHYTYAFGTEWMHGAGNVEIAANFTATPLSGIAPLSVQLTDHSTGPDIIAWNYDVMLPGGGNSTYTTKNPLISLSALGNYTIKQTIYNYTKTKTLMRSDYITVAATGETGEFYMDIGVVDKSSGGFLNGATLNIYDTNTSTWSNGTVPVGSRHFASGTGHIYNAYASNPGYAGGSALGLTAYPSAFYLIALNPPGLDPGPGNVNLYVTAYGSDQVAPMPGVQITAVISGGATTAEVTGSNGVSTFVLPNSTLIYVSGSKAGYQKVTSTITLTNVTDQYLNLALQKATVTTAPTQTIVPGELTTRPTVDPNDPAITGNTNAKAQEMMNWLAMNGMDLVQLAFLVTVLAFLGVKLGGK